MFSALRSLFSHYVHTVLQISLAISSYTETALKSCLLLIFSCIECATDRSPGPSTMHSLFVSAFMNPASLHAGKQVSTGVGSSTLVQPKTKFFNLATHWKMGFFYETFCQI